MSMQWKQKCGLDHAQPLKDCGLIQLTQIGGTQKVGYGSNDGEWLFSKRLEQMHFNLNFVAKIMDSATQ